MSWGERSCLKPCRCPQNCSIEKCNVNCICYVWDGSTEPDSKKEVKLSETRSGKILKEFGLDKDYLDSLKETENKLMGIDLESEYKLIQNKKSKLSSSLRYMVTRRYESLTWKK
jgi:hypothetical protein